MIQGFELHTVLEAFCQQGLLVPTLERLCVNVIGLPYVCGRFYYRLGHTYYVIAGAVSLHCHTKSNPHWHWNTPLTFDLDLVSR